MTQKIYAAIAAFILAMGLVFGFTATVSAGAAGAARDDVCEGINVGGGACNDDGEGLTGVIKLVIRIISVVAGIAAVIMIIVGGFRYITSGGDASKVASAKNAIIYAIVGLVIVALAQLIVRYVANTATNQ